MPRKIAYIMSRFPKVTETFILYEMVELQNLGVQVEVFPILREHESVTHPEAQAFVDRAHYRKPLSRRVLATQFYWLFKNPGGYFRAWWETLRGNMVSPKFLSRALLVVPLAAQFAREMQELGVEHVHAHYATHPALAAYVIHQLTNLPYSVTAHAHDIYVERAMLGEKLKDAELIVAISEYNRNLLGELYGESIRAKTQVVHCGIDPSIFQPRVVQKTDDQFKIICVASLQDYKGQTYLIDACTRLKEQGINFHCSFVGEGEDRPQLEAQIAQLGLSEHVTLMGRQPRQRVSELLAEADVMVLPSVVTPSGKKEGIPVALMEALATEMPVIATSISGIPELIEHEQTGLLVQERNPQALADAILKLYNNRELGKEFGVRGREKVLREFNLHTNTQTLYELFEQKLTPAH